MHMADALISPAVGGTMWVAAGGLVAWAARRLAKTMDEKAVPLMGVLGAFVFAAQMINFTIPATGSSGHLGGGMLLAALLGPHAAFLTISSVLTVQALFFADGGLLALGCNIINLGLFPCFIAYPLIWLPLTKDNPRRGRIALAAILSCIFGLQLGALGVVLETTASGISELPFSTFLALMLPIHLAIGLVEGLVTAAVVGVVRSARPEVLDMARGATVQADVRGLLAGLAVTALVVGGGLSWFASADPDGLEWAMAKVSGKEELDAPADGVHAVLAQLQEKTSLLPDYAFKTPEPAGHDVSEEKGPSWPAVDAGTSVSGVVGGVATLLLAGLVGFVLRRRAPAQRA